MRRVLHVRIKLVTGGGGGSCARRQLTGLGRSWQPLLANLYDSRRSLWTREIVRVGVGRKNDRRYRMCEVLEKKRDKKKQSWTRNKREKKSKTQGVTPLRAYNYATSSLAWANPLALHPSTGNSLAFRAHYQCKSRKVFPSFRLLALLLTPSFLLPWLFVTRILANRFEYVAPSLDTSGSYCKFS